MIESLNNQFKSLSANMASTFQSPLTAKYNSLATSLPWLQQGNNGSASVTYKSQAQEPTIMDPAKVAAEEKRVADIRYNESQRAIPSDVQFNSSYHENYDNGNPMMVGGWGTVNYAGKSFNVPNWLINEQNYAQTWNQGRYNAADMFTGGQPAPAGMTANYDLVNQRMDQYRKANPELEKAQIINPYERAKREASQEAYNYQNAQQVYQSSPLTETRDISGKVTGGDYASRTADLEAARVKNQQAQDNLNSWQSGGRGKRLAAGDVEAKYRDPGLRDAFRPTYSNLKIEEKLIY